LRVSLGNHAALQQTISRAHYGCTSGSVSRRLGFGENRGYLPTANPPSSGKLPDYGGQVNTNDS